MCWQGIFLQIRAWSEILWPEDRAAREQAKRDRLYRLLQRRFVGLVRRREHLETLRQSATPADPRLRRQEAEYQRGLKELERIKRQITRLR